MTFEPDPRRADAAAFCAAMRARAECVVAIPDREIASVRVTRRVTQNQLFIARERGGVRAVGYRAVQRPPPTVYRYLLPEGEEAEVATRRLAHRFGARFELATTRAYGSRTGSRPGCGMSEWGHPDGGVWLRPPASPPTSSIHGPAVKGRPADQNVILLRPRQRPTPDVNGDDAHAGYDHREQKEG